MVAAATASVAVPPAVDPLGEATMTWMLRRISEACLIMETSEELRIGGYYLCRSTEALDWPICTEMLSLIGTELAGDNLPNHWLIDRCMVSGLCAGETLSSLSRETDLLV